MRLGTIHPENGHTQYYLSLTPGAWKTFNTEDNSFWCCTGSGVEEYSKLNDSIYWHDDEGIYVNLFIASELNWPDRGLKLRQENNTIIVRSEKPVQTSIRIRIPEWAAGASAKLNGKPLDASASPGSYLTLSRIWKTGDRIELSFPMRLRVETMPDDPKQQAFLYGPLVLAGDLGSDGLTEELITGSNVPQIRRVRQIEIPEFRGDPLSFIKTGEAPNTFRTAGQRKDVNLAPINSIFGRRYNVYWLVS